MTVVTIDALAELVDGQDEQPVRQLAKRAGAEADWEGSPVGRLTKMGWLSPPWKRMDDFFGCAKHDPAGLDEAV